MAYISCLHQPGSTRVALKLALIEAETDCLVLGRANRLETYTRHEEDDRLQLVASQTVYGNISGLEKFRPASATTDHLFVLTDRSEYFILSWNHETQRLQTQNSVVSLAEFAQRDAAHEDRLHIDPSHRFMTLEIHEGVIHVLPIARESKRAKVQVEPGTLGACTATRIPELGVKSSCFLHKRSGKDSRDKPQIALLHSDAAEKTQITVRELTFIYSNNKDQPDDASFEGDNVKEVTGEVELGASHLISLAPPVYGFLVIGETSIAYCDQWHFKLRTDPLPEATIFVAWEQLDDRRYLLADDYSRLWMLMIKLDQRDDYNGFHIDLIGKTARASTLIHLDNGIVFLGSHNSDSQLLRIRERSIEVLQTFSNLAPIIDFTIMDMGNRSSEAQVNEYSSGQARLVTGSGAYSDGSLRSVRSGVGVDDLGTIGTMHNIKELFSLDIGSASRGCDTLLVSFVTHSRAFIISSEGELDEVDQLCGIDLTSPTILTETLLGDRIVHVSPTTIALCDINQRSVLATFTAPDSITAATLIQSEGSARLLVSIAGSNLASISISNSSLGEPKTIDFGTDLQVSCIGTSSLFPRLAVVGFWQDSRVSLLDLETLAVVKSIMVEEVALAVPRSLAIAKLATINDPILFIGMANGEVVSYSISGQDAASISLNDRKSIILGNQQAQLKVLRESGSLHEQVVALCEHPSLIYGSERRPVYSAITAEEATCMCILDNEAFPDAIAMATESELKLATIDREKTTHVQTLAVGRTIRRLAYSAHYKAFLLGTIKRTLDDQVERIESHVELVDEVAFKSIAEYALHEDELVGACIRAELDEGLDESVQRFVVGTQYIETPDTTAHRGRLLVLEVSEDRKLKVVSETMLKGACHCLAMCQGKIVAGLMKSVVIYDLTHERGSLPRLEKLISYRVATLPVDISVNGDVIAVSDLIKSATLLRLVYKEDDGDWNLLEVARHRETAWATCITPIDQDVWLQADAETNLGVMQYDASGYSEEDRQRLKVTSELRLGEMVNRMRPVTVHPTPGAMVIPRAFCATVEGGIYLVSTITPEKQDVLMRMQERMAELVPSLGNVSFEEYRAFHSRVRTGSGPERFVDGELIEQFLGCAEDVQAKIADGLGDVVTLKAMVEDLKRLH